MTRPSGPRYPWAPLQAILDLHVPDTLGQARILGVDPKQVYRWRELGVPETYADELAVRLGMLPYELWPEMLEAAIGETTKACTECAESFVPARRNQKFCGVPCKHRYHSRNYERRRYSDDPDYRQRKIETAARYYAETSELRRRRADREVA